jgi:Raf kinase inhibitor-like YbhB/YbcL family protein
MEEHMRKLFFILCSTLTINSFADTPPETPAAPAFTLNTTAFLDQGALPVLYTCDGKNVSPELDWANLPTKTQSLALIVADPDAPNGVFYHWVVFNIPKTVTALTEGMDKLPAGSLAAKNSWEKLNYNGPCPPKGAAHTYTITLYALDSKLPLPPGTKANQVMEAIQKHTVGKVELTTVYSRWLQ